MRLLPWEALSQWPQPSPPKHLASSSDGQGRPHVPSLPLLGAPGPAFHMLLGCRPHPVVTPPARPPCNSNLGHSVTSSGAGLHLDPRAPWAPRAGTCLWARGCWCLTLEVLGPAPHREVGWLPDRLFRPQVGSGCAQRGSLGSAQMGAPRALSTCTLQWAILMLPGGCLGTSWPALLLREVLQVPGSQVLAVPCAPPRGWGWDCPGSGKGRFGCFILHREGWVWP